MTHGRRRAPGTPASIVPPSPRHGDTVGIVALASPVEKSALEAGAERLRRMGYKVFFFESILEQDLFFAGSAARRAWELEQMFTKDFVKAIVCARGGYGSQQLLPHLDLEVIRGNPKMLMGYSDNTALLTWLCDQTGMVTCHGPMAAVDFADDPQDKLPPLAGDSLDIDIQSGEQVRHGSAEGILYGGCLSLLVASLSTPYEIETSNTMLFLEDVNAKPYQLHRMLTQLRFAGKLDSVRAIVFGEMKGCGQPDGQEYTLQEVLRRALEGLDIPVGFGLRSGHVTQQPNLTLPLGLHVRVEVGQGRIRLQS